jgi:hypothetical protein
MLMKWALVPLLMALLEVPADAAAAQRSRVVLVRLAVPVVPVVVAEAAARENKLLI